MHEPFEPSEEVSNKAGGPSDTVPHFATLTYKEPDVSPTASEIEHDVEAQTDIRQNESKSKAKSFDLYLLPIILVTIAIILCLVVALCLNGTSGTPRRSGGPIGWRGSGESARDKVIRALKNKWDAGLEVIQTKGDGNCLLYSLCEYRKEQGFVESLEECAKEQREEIVWYTIDHRNLKRFGPQGCAPYVEGVPKDDYEGIVEAHRTDKLHHYFTDKTWMARGHVKAFQQKENDENVFLFEIENAGGPRGYSPNTGIGVRVHRFIRNNNGLDHQKPCGILHVNGNHFEFVKFSKTLGQLRADGLIRDTDVVDHFAVDLDGAEARLVDPRHPPREEGAAGA